MEKKKKKKIMMKKKKSKLLNVETIYKVASEINAKTVRR